MDIGPTGYLIGKRVNISAGGVVYTGILMEISDSEVHLQTDMQWITLEMDNIASIELADTHTTTP